MIFRGHNGQLTPPIQKQESLVMTGRRKHYSENVLYVRSDDLHTVTSFGSVVVTFVEHFKQNDKQTQALSQKPCLDHRTDIDRKATSQERCCVLKHLTYCHDVCGRGKTRK